MTLDGFVNRWENDPKGIDFDGAFSTQCMDLYRAYVRDVLGYPQSPPVVGAKDVWDTYLKTHYTRVANTSDGVPPRGSVMIWSGKYGPFGHIAIVLEADKNSFTAFSQNDPLGAKCIKKVYNYNNVLGWLIPNSLNEPDPIMDKVDLGGLVTELETYGVVELQTLKSKLTAKDKALKGFESSLYVLTNKVEQALRENEEVREMLAKAREGVQKLDENRVKLEKEIKDLKDNQKEPVFTSALGKFLYQLAKSLG